MRIFISKVALECLKDKERYQDVTAIITTKPAQYFFCGANNERLVEAFAVGYARRISYIPNLYDLNSTPVPVHHIYDSGTLRIGAFGALRIQKNFTNAAWAALAIARHYRAPLEFYVNAGRTDNNGNVVERAIRAATDNLPGVTLKDVIWQEPLDFRRVVSQMHLLIQPSYSETFSMVTADAIAEGVPVVVSPAMEWAPNYWKANPDDTAEIAKVGIRHLRDSHSAYDGYQALVQYNRRSLQVWRDFLTA